MYAILPGVDIYVKTMSMLDYAFGAHFSLKKKTQVNNFLSSFAFLSFISFSFRFFAPKFSFLRNDMTLPLSSYSNSFLAPPAFLSSTDSLQVRTEAPAGRTIYVDSRGVVGPCTAWKWLFYTKPLSKYKFSFAQELFYVYINGIQMLVHVYVEK